MFVILLPVLNEIETILEFITRIQHVMQTNTCKLVVIDDGSTDGTLDVLTELAEQNAFDLIHRKKTIRGCARGKALIDGLRYAFDKYPEAQYFIEMDTDGAHHPEEIERGLAILQNGYDVAIGSKYLQGSVVSNRGVLRTFISYCNTRILQWLLHPDITDYSNGFRLYNRKAAVIAVVNQFTYDTPIYLGEVLALWLKHHLRVGEFASTYTERKKGNSKVRWSDVWQGLKGVWHIYKNRK